MKSIILMIFKLMKALGKFFLAIFVIALIIASGIGIREFILIEQNSTYNLPHIYKNFDFTNIKAEFPTILIVKSEKYNTFVGSVSKDMGKTNEFIFTSKTGSNEIESIVYYTENKCSREKEINPDLLRTIGVPVIFPSKQVKTFVQDPEKFSDVYSYYYQSFFDDLIISLNCVIKEGESSSTINVEVVDIETLSNQLDIQKENFWNELELLSY